MLLVIHSFNIVDELSGALMADGGLVDFQTFVLRIRYTVLCDGVVSHCSPFLALLLGSYDMILIMHNSQENITTYIHCVILSGRASYTAGQSILRGTFCISAKSSISTWPQTFSLPCLISFHNVLLEELGKKPTETAAPNNTKNPTRVTSKPPPKHISQ